MKGWKIISPISMYPNGGHESTNHFKARFEWKCSAELWRNGDKKRGWVRISGFFFTRMKIAQNPWLYRYRNVVYANENKSCIGETSTRLESSAGATLFALENEFPMPFGRAEIHGPAGYTQPIFRQNELFAVVPPFLLPPPPLSCSFVWCALVTRSDTLVGRNN